MMGKNAIVDEPRHPNPNPNNMYVVSEWKMNTCI
jgi:hypothetical protein